MEPDNPAAILLGVIAFGLGLWGLLEIAFLEGTKGRNEFGPDPVGVRIG